MTQKSTHDEWNRLKGRIQAKWSKLDRNEIEEAKDDPARLRRQLEEKYGYSKEQARKELDELRRDLH